MLFVVDENIPGAQEAFGRLATVRTVPGRSLSREQLRDADALIVRSVTRVDRELLHDTPVRFVGTATIGVDHIDRAYLAEAGIGFASAAGCNARSVVEYVITALLEIAVAHGITLAGETLTGKTLGIVGHGNIGSRLARVAPVLGLRVLVNDPPLERAGHPGPFVPLDHLLQHSDFVTLHVPKVTTGPDRTIGLIDSTRLATMKSTAWLLNSSRGDVVVGNDLKAALAAKRIAGAVLDVWEGEPAIDRELMDAVSLATPHIAGYSLEGKMNGTTMMHDAAAAHFQINDPWRPEMPPVPDSQVSTESTNLQDALLAAARASYPIRSDDARFREGRDLPPEQWRLHFDRLRREYPVRREFANYTITLPDPDTPVAESLTGLGFRIERRK